MKKIMLYGPPVNINNKKGYGGGMGGYVRNMSIYISEFQFMDIELVPVYHTINGQYNAGFLTLPVRFFIDMFKILVSIVKLKPDGIHCMAHSGRALPRELTLLLICRTLKIPFLYQIRGGAFANIYNEGNSAYKRAVEFIINKSKLILCQGKKDVKYIKTKFKTNSYYFPNVVRDSELPQIVAKKLQTNKLSVLFVGYCYRDKGVFELVEACKLAFLSGIDIKLTFVGAEHLEFTKYLDLVEREQLFEIKRMGKLPHKEVLRIYKRNDIYCYPTSHKGEGHNNSINEAMMMNLIIITTRTGFVNEILDDSSAYFLEAVEPNEICNVFKEINLNRESALVKAKNASTFLINNLLSSTANKQIYGYYKELITK